MEMVCQLSYPLNSANARPSGTCTVYLSWAEIAFAPKTASTIVVIPIASMLLRFTGITPLSGWSLDFIFYQVVLNGLATLFISELNVNFVNGMRSQRRM